jgi:hypothetical protein
MQDSSIFSTLPQISSQPPYIRWIADPKLQRYIDRLNTADLGFIAYHLVTTTPTPNNNACLTALLAHIAFIPAHRLRSTHTTLQQYYTEDLADLYQIGLEIVSDPRKFLSNFEPDRSLNTGYWYPNFYKWSQQKFDLHLTDKIRSQKGMSGFKRTSLGLVVRATSTKIIKALTQQGYPVATHPIYLTLHCCLEQAVKAKRFNTAQPQAADYAEILALYRQQQIPPLDYDRIVTYLTQLGKAVSNYDRLRVESIDLPISDDNENRTLIDRIPSPENPLDTAILTEYQQQVDRLKNIIIELLQQLEIEPDRLLLLLHGLDLNQKESGKQIGCHQTTVMHRNNRIMATLAQDIYHRTSDRSLPLSSDRLEQIAIHAIEFCRQYYPDLLTEVIQQVVGKDLHAAIDRVQSRWQIQFQPNGLAIERLTKIINETPSTQL